MTQRMDDALDPTEVHRPVEAAGVARRSLILSAVVCRGSIDHGAKHPEAVSLRQRILDWLTSLNLWHDVEPSERDILHAPVGELEAKQATRATWYAEGLAVLSWALNRLRFPRHDEKVHPLTVTDSVCFLGEDAAEFISGATLRSLTELHACRELLYAIHCRIRDFARNRDHKEFNRWLEQSWLTCLALEANHLIVDGDLAIDDQVIAEVRESRLQECESITCERHRAIIWLRGEDPVFSEVRVDT